MRATRLFTLLTATAFLAGCQVGAPAASPRPAPTPSSIAYQPGVLPPPPGGWTTPRVPETAGRLEKGGQTVSIMGMPVHVPQSVIDLTQGGRDARVGDALERRTRVGSLRGGPAEWIGTFQTTYQWGTELDHPGDAPDLFTNRFRLSHELSTPLFGRLGIYGDYTNRNYTFSGTNGLIPGTEDPWGTAHRIAVGVNMFQPVAEAWAVFLATDVRWHAEDGADLSDGFTWSVTAGFGYRPSDVLDLGLGVIVSDSFAGELFIIGGPQFDWRPNKEWRFVLSGTQMEIQRNIGRSWQIAGAGAFLAHRFRLNDSGPLPSGIVAERRIPIWIQARYRGIPDLDMTLRVGVDLVREFRIENANGSTFGTHTTDPSPFVSFRAILRL